MINKKFIFNYKPVTITVATRSIGRIEMAEEERSGEQGLGNGEEEMGNGADGDVRREIFGNNSRINFRFYCR